MDTSYHGVALRFLLDDAIAHGELQEAARMGRELETDPHCTFDDKVNLLTLLQAAKAEDASPFFDALKATALEDSHAMATLLVWMVRNGKAADALEWARQFPPKLISAAEVDAALALCYLSVRDWAGLETFATDANWQDFDYLRLALLARAMREEGEKEVSATHWQEAATLAIRRNYRAKGLVGLAMEWGWDHEAQDLLSQIDKPSESEKAALVALYRRFALNRDTRGLLQSSEKMMRLSPKDDRLTNDFAMYSLLLKHNVAEARMIAKELFERHRSDPAYVSTYALSLFANADFENALKTMNTLTPEQLKMPEIAAYYAVILCANGQNEEAMKFFDLAKSGKFLPEEEELIERSRP